MKDKKCKKLSLDLMHLSTREFEEIKDLEGLKKHLKECADCRKKLKQLIDVDVFIFLTNPRSEKFKKGMKALMDKIKASEKPEKKIN
jgi:copper homeostasis protein CutC